MLTPPPYRLTPPPYRPEYVPQRGHVVWMNFRPQAGEEIRDWRPALVLSPQIFNCKKSVAVVCPITRTIRGGVFEIKIPDGIASESYPDEKLGGVVRADQARSLDWKVRGARFVCGMPQAIVWDTANMVHAMIWGEDPPIP